MNFGCLRPPPEPDAEFPVYWQAMRVYYEDTDAGGIVYHANYLRFLERARTEWIRAVGLEQDQLREETGIIFVVAGMDIKWRKPAKFNELLLVNAGISEFKRASMGFSQSVFRHLSDAPSDERGAGELLLTATVRAGAIQADTGKPVALPREYFQC